MTTIDIDEPLWGAAAIAPVIGKSLTQTNYLLGRGLIDADKIGRQWVSTRRRLLSQFIGRQANSGTSTVDVFCHQHAGIAPCDEVARLDSDRDGLAPLARSARRSIR
jgi:hypothetical protein